MSTYVVGDLQGCYEELQQLLTRVQFSYAKDSLWLVGDLVCRGPASLQVLEFLMEFPGKLHCVLGNHDLNLLAVSQGIRALRKEDHIEDVLLSSKWPYFEKWLRHLPLLHYDDQLKTVMTHAGIYPFWSLTQAMAYALEVEAFLKSENYVELLTVMFGNEPEYWSEELHGPERYRFIINAFTRMRTLSINGAMEFAFNRTLAEMPQDLKPWFAFSNASLAKTQVVFGHWAALQGITHQPGIQALDTGCAWGNALTALRLEDGQRFSIACNSDAVRS